MAELTDKELKVLNEEIEKDGLTYIELQKELLDHLCCDIEAKMDEGMEFLRALEEVKKGMKHNCIRQIQEDTLLLINQKYRIMKKIMYILGVMAPSLVIIGTLFKIQHWPGANILLVIGLTLLAALYLPVFVTIKIRDTRKKGLAVNTPMYIIGLVAGITFILGALFKIMHWPGAGFVLAFSSLFAVLVFIPILVIHALKDKENQLQSFTTLIFVLSFAAIAFMTFALRVSTNVMNSFLLSVEDNLKTEELLLLNNEIVYNTLNMEDQDIQEKAGLLKERSDSLNEYIDELIRKIILEADAKNEEAFDSGKIDFSLVRDLDHVNAPDIVMLDLDGGQNQGVVLERKLKEHRQYLLSLSEPESYSLINTLLDTSPIEEGNYTTSWISHNFEHLPMISVVNRLIGLQGDIRLLEKEILIHIRDNSEKTALASN